MDKNKLIHIGTFSEPVGLKGEVKVTNFTNNFNSYVKLGNIVDENGIKAWKIKKIRMTKKKLIMKLDTVNSLESIKKLKGKKLFVKRSDLPKTKKNEFYVSDLVDCKVVSNLTPISTSQRIVSALRSTVNFTTSL